MRKLLTGLLIMPSLLWAAPTDELLSKLQKLESMKGQFEQMVLDQGGTHMQEAEGEFQVARGNRFYWSTAMPFEQLAVSDGSTVWVYDKDLEQVVVRCRKLDVGVGVHMPPHIFTNDRAKRLMSLGMNWILDGADVAWAIHGMKQRREALGFGPATAPTAGDGEVASCLISEQDQPSEST